MPPVWNNNVLGIGWAIAGRGSSRLRRHGLNFVRREVDAAIRVSTMLIVCVCISKQAIRWRYERFVGRKTVRVEFRGLH